MLTYEEMFVPISVDYLRSLHQEHQQEVTRIAEEFFKVDFTFNPIKNKRKAIAISLFCTNRMNAYYNEYPIHEKEKVQCHDRYLMPLFKNLEQFAQSFSAEEWKVSLYLCPHSLEQFKPERDIFEELRGFNFLEIHVMRHPTVGHGPGALWRFLAMSDMGLDELLIYDIDESWHKSRNQWYKEVKQYDKAFSRGVLIPNDFGWLKPEKPWTGKTGMKGYPPILASKIYVRPQKLGIPDIDTLAAAHIFQRQNQAKTENPNSQLAIDEPITPYNQSSHAHPYGFGNHWYKYCFDERFLKHVIFPFVAERGELCTYCLPQDVMENIGSYLSLPTLCDYLADFQYIQRKNKRNILINQHRVNEELL
ncbi:MAG: hypothetical protein AAF798_07180 [Bacteroidota bacterium]